MRRTDKEILDQEEIFQVIDRATYCHLALSAGDEPYLIPLSFGRNGSSIFVHTAIEGEKIKFMANNPVARLSFECDVKLVNSSIEACKWTFSFYSVIARGRLGELTEPDRKRAGLDVIMAHYSDRHWTFPDAGIDRVRVWEIPLIEMTGKRTADKSDLG